MLKQSFAMISILALTTLGGCGKGSASGGGDTGSTGQDWSGKPLDTAVADTVNKVAFTLQLPKGMKEEAGKPDDLTRTWKADVADNFSEPTVMIGFEAIPAKDLAGFVKDALSGSKDVVAKQAATADGFIVVHHDATKGIATVELMKSKGDNHLTCTAAQAKGGGLPNFDKTVAWLQSICDSLTLK